VVDQDGEQLGVMTPEEGRTRAEEQGLDLVEVAPNSQPPVCRIMDYGKFKYEEKKKKAAGKSKGSASLKEVKLRPGTDDHDMSFKLKNARRFLMDGDKVKVTVMFRGREMVHRQMGYKQLDRVRELLGELAATENPPRMEGRFLSMILVGNREEIAKLRKIEAAEEKAAKASEPDEGGDAGVAEASAEPKKAEEAAEKPAEASAPDEGGDAETGEATAGGS